MTPADVARAYNALGPGEQASFAETLRKLLGESLLWRDDPDDRAAYRFLQLHGDLVRGYLAPGGWSLQHHEAARIFFLHRADGAHRRRLSRDLTIWLLLARLLYAEARERPQATLTANPVARAADFAERYASFLPGQRVRKKTSLAEGLRALQGLKVIRPAGQAGWNPTDPEALVELLPALEVVVSSGEISRLTEQLQAFAAGAEAQTEAEDEDAP